MSQWGKLQLYDDDIKGIHITYLTHYDTKAFEPIDKNSTLDGFVIIDVGDCSITVAREIIIKEFEEYIEDEL